MLTKFDTYPGWAKYPEFRAMIPRIKMPYPEIHTAVDPDSRQKIVLDPGELVKEDENLIESIHTKRRVVVDDENTKRESSTGGEHLHYGSTEPRRENQVITISAPYSPAMFEIQMFPEARTLGRVLEKMEIDKKSALQVLLEVGKLMQFVVNEFGRIHGDLHFGNILVSKNKQNGRWQVFVIDWENACKIGESHFKLEKAFVEGLHPDIYINAEDSQSPFLELKPAFDIFMMTYGIYRDLFGFRSIIWQNRLYRANPYQYKIDYVEDVKHQIGKLRSIYRARRVFGEVKWLTQYLFLKPKRSDSDKEKRLAELGFEYALLDFMETYLTADYDWSGYTWENWIRDLEEVLAKAK